MNEFGKKNTIWIAVVALLVMIPALYWANLQFSRRNPGGTDFLVHWQGTRDLLWEGISPYSDVTAVRIQNRIYGRPAKASEHQMRVVYPLYSSAFFVPFAFISDFNIARALWMTLSEILLIWMALLSLKLTRWKPSMPIAGLLLAFSLLWYHAVRAVINGNAVVLVAILFVLSLSAIERRRDELAGILLALATIKPNVVLLPLLGLLVWVGFQKRWTVIGWFLGSLGVLVLAANAVIPHWIFQNLREVIRYPTYNPPGTPAAILGTWFPPIGAGLGRAVSGAVLLILLVEWGIACRHNFQWALWAVALTVALSPWAGITTDPGNYIFLYFSLVLVLSVWYKRWPRSGKWVVSAGLLALFLGLWGIFLSTLQTVQGQPQQHSILFFPMPLFLLIGLYWVRWWAVRPALLSVGPIAEEE